MSSSEGICQSLVVKVIVVTMLVTWLTGISAANDDDERVTWPLLDVGRLWLRATMQQVDRVVDVLLLMSIAAKLVLAVIGLLLLVRLYRFFFLPIDRVKHLGDVGYMSDGRQPMKDVIEQVRRRRAVGDVPPVYPNGWFAIIESRSLSVGAVKNIFCLGKI